MDSAPEAMKQIVEERFDRPQPASRTTGLLVCPRAWTNQRADVSVHSMFSPYRETGDETKNFSLYTLTSICSVEYIKSVESVFEIIAEPNRRAILSLLVSSQQSVGEIEHQLHMPQPTVSKHLRVLREAGFVESTVDAQRRLYRLRPEPFQEVDAWLAPFRRFWSAHVDALERHLDRMDQSTPSKKKTRKGRRGPNRERNRGETK